MNRCLIVKSFYPELSIKGESSCDDVLAMQGAVTQFHQHKNEPLHCGAAGTTFRFLCARVSREQGRFRLTGDKRLFERPHQPLFQSLSSLGVTVEQTSATELTVSSQGWNLEKPLNMDLKISSQFISAILLSAWELSHPLVIKLGVDRHSYSYLEMTITLLKQLGMEIEVSNDQICVPPHQSLRLKDFCVEPDMSSAFALTSLALASGQLELNQFPENSVQPDFYFIELLKLMGADYQLENNKLIVKRSLGLSPVKVDLSNNPDLFPVLAVLLSRVEGGSELTGLSLLSYKESDRLGHICDFLLRLGFMVEQRQGCFLIHGKLEHKYPEAFAFDPDQDHRLVMAASLAQHQGARLIIKTPDVVNKSFPEFWRIVNS